MDTRKKLWRAAQVAALHNFLKINFPRVGLEIAFCNRPFGTPEGTLPACKKGAPGAFFCTLWAAPLFESARLIPPARMVRIEYADTLPKSAVPQLYINY